jgi:hypothetical protein
MASAARAPYELVGKTGGLMIGQRATFRIVTMRSPPATIPFRGPPSLFYSPEKAIGISHDKGKAPPRLRVSFEKPM